MWGDKKMKKFAIVLMMALLVLGCVFAASGDAVVLEVNLENIVPVYEIYGSLDGSSYTKGVAGINNDADIASATGGVISKDITTEDETVTLTILIKEHGLKESDNSAKAYIRYKGDVSVTVTSSSLRNVKYLNGADVSKTETGEVTSFTEPTISWDDTADHTIRKTSAANASVVLASKFLTGKKVGASGATTDGWNVASWTWTWDTTSLIGGETYRADIKLTYTVE